MKREWLVTVFGLWVTALVGCTSSSNAVAPPAKESPRACNQTIEAFCADRPCASFDEELASARRLKEPSPARFGPWSYSVATCGELRLISEQEGMGSGESAFDAQGRLVAIRGAADSPTECGENAWSAGVADECKAPQVIESASGFADQKQ